MILSRKYLTALRIQAGMGMRYAAERMGFLPSDLCDFEHERRNFSKDAKRYMLAVYLGYEAGVPVHKTEKEDWRQPKTKYRRSVRGAYLS